MIELLGMIGLVTNVIAAGIVVLLGYMFLTINKDQEFARAEDAKRRLIAERLRMHTEWEAEGKASAFDDIR